MLDLAIFNQNYDIISILSRTVEGKFQEQKFYKTDGAALSIVVDDFDHDKKMDIFKQRIETRNK